MNNPLSFKGVIFDFNGVIVDDYVLQKAAWDRISFELRSRPVNDAEMLQNIRGVPTADILAWMSGRKLELSEIRHFVNKKDQMVKELYLTSPLFKLNQGLEDFLNLLQKQKIPKTLATSSSLEMTRSSFYRLNLDRWFSFTKIVYNDGTYQGKPAPDAYRLAARHLQLEPRWCVVFEDSKSGVISAYKAGIGKIIAVGSQEHLKQLLHLPGVAFGIQDFAELDATSLFD